MSYIQIADSENLPPDSKFARVKDYLDELTTFWAIQPNIYNFCNCSRYDVFNFNFLS